MTPALRRIVVHAVFETAVVLGVFVAGVVLLGRDIDIFGAIAIAASIVAGFQVAIHVRALEPRAVPLEQPRQIGKPFARYESIREVLRWSQMSEDHFNASLRPMLIELADDRLRRLRGIDRNLEPERAAAVLGDPLATFVTSGERRLLGASELGALVGRLEQIAESPTL